MFVTRQITTDYIRPLFSYSRSQCLRQHKHKTKIVRIETELFSFPWAGGSDVYVRDTTAERFTLYGFDNALLSQSYCSNFALYGFDNTLLSQSYSSNFTLYGFDNTLLSQSYCSNCAHYGFNDTLLSRSYCSNISQILWRAVTL